MAAFGKFYVFVHDIGLSVHNCNNHVFQLYLSNATPDQNNHIQKSNLAEITEANGYNHSNNIGTQAWTRANNIAYLTANNFTWTASGGNFGPFRYVIMYNANSGTNDDTRRLIGYWDYGSSINCNNGESFSWNVPAGGNIANLT